MFFICIVNCIHSGHSGHHFMNKIYFISVNCGDKIDYSQKNNTNLGDLIDETLTSKFLFHHKNDVNRNANAIINIL